MLAETEAQASLRETVLRISGAMQVLQELLAQEAEPPTTDGAEQPEAAAKDASVRD